MDRADNKPADQAVPSASISGADWAGLAGSRAGKGHRELARAIGGVFDSARAPEARALSSEMLAQLLAGADLELRWALAARLAEEDDAPIGLVRMLAADVLVVAQPLLAHSSVLDDETLVALLAQVEPTHWRIIAGRPEVGTALAQALVDTGDIDTAVKLLGNAGARLPLLAMTKLVKMARTEDMLRVPLVGRPELDEESAADLYWTVAQPLRQEILRRFAIVPERLDRALSEALRAVIAGEAFPEGRSAYGYAALQAWAQSLARSGAVDAKLLIRVLREREVAAFAALLGAAGSWHPTLVNAMLAETGAKRLSIACRSLGIDKPDFASIFLLSRSGRTGEQKVDPNELRRVLALYDRISPEFAIAAAAGWQP